MADDWERIKQVINVHDVLAALGKTDIPKKDGVYACPITKHRGAAQFSITDNGQHWKCFACGGEQGDIFDLVHALGSVGSAFMFCARLSGVQLSAPEPTMRCPATVSKSATVGPPAWRATWDAATPDTGPISDYLQARGLSGDVPATFRFDPACYYGEGNEPPRNLPAMLAPVTDYTGQQVAIHRTYLAPLPEPPGKASVGKAKKAWGPIASAHIALKGIEGDTAGTCEGIETGLAVQESAGIPILAGINAGNMAELQLPPGIKVLHIFMDLDPPKGKPGRKRQAGQEAAQALAERYAAAGLTVYLHRPEGAGWPDFLDMFVDPEYGPDSILARFEQQAAFVDDPSTRGSVLLSEWLLLELPRPPEIIHGILPMGLTFCMYGPPKIGKSWWILQAAYCAALGIPLAGIPTTRTRVLLVQYEIPSPYFHERCTIMAKALDVKAADMSWLRVWNLRGKDSRHNLAETMIEELRNTRSELLVLDPFYKLLMGDENNAVDVTPLLMAFDEVCTVTGCALMYLHHTPKGLAGDRPTVDAAAGSNTITRDCDGLWRLIPHSTEGLHVLENVGRCNESAKTMTLEFRNGIYEAIDVEPEIASSAPRARRKATAKDDIDPQDMLKWFVFHGRCEQKGEWIKRLSQNMSRPCANAVLDSLVETKDLVVHTGQNNAHYIGTPEQVQQYVARAAAGSDQDSDITF